MRQSLANTTMIHAYDIYEYIQHGSSLAMSRADLNSTFPMVLSFYDSLVIRDVTGMIALLLAWLFRKHLLWHCLPWQVLGPESPLVRIDIVRNGLVVQP